MRNPNYSRSIISLLQYIDINHPDLDKATQQALAPHLEKLRNLQQGTLTAENLIQILIELHTLFNKKLVSIPLSAPLMEQAAQLAVPVTTNLAVDDGSSSDPALASSPIAGDVSSDEEPALVAVGVVASSELVKAIEKLAAKTNLLEFTQVKEEKSYGNVGENWVHAPQAKRALFASTNTPVELDEKQAHFRQHLCINITSQLLNEIFEHLRKMFEIEQNTEALNKLTQNNLPALNAVLELLMQSMNITRLQKNYNAKLVDCDDITGQDAIVMLGKTGAGKTTTAHVIAGSTLKGKTHDLTVANASPLLEKFEIGNAKSGQSETKHFRAVDLKALDKTKEPIFLCDTAGFLDTADRAKSGAEGVENVLVTTSRLRTAKSLRFLVLISTNEITARVGSIVDVIDSVAKLITSARHNLKSIYFAFTGVANEDFQGRLLAQLDSIIEDRKKFGVSESALPLFEELRGQCAKRLPYIDISSSFKLSFSSKRTCLSGSDLLAELMKLKPMENPAESIRTFIEQANEAKLKMELQKYSKVVFDNFAELNDIVQRIGKGENIQNIEEFIALRLAAIEDRLQGLIFIRDCRFINVDVGVDVMKIAAKQSFLLKLLLQAAQQILDSKARVDLNLDAIERFKKLQAIYENFVVRLKTVFDLDNKNKDGKEQAQFLNQAGDYLQGLIKQLEAFPVVEKLDFECKLLSNLSDDALFTVFNDLGKKPNALADFKVEQQRKLIEATDAVCPADDVERLAQIIGNINFCYRNLGIALSAQDSTAVHVFMQARIAVSEEFIDEALKLNDFQAAAALIARAVKINALGPKYACEEKITEMKARFLRELFARVPKQFQQHEVGIDLNKDKTAGIQFVMKTIYDLQQNPEYKVLFAKFETKIDGITKSLRSIYELIQANLHLCMENVSKKLKESFASNKLTDFKMLTDPLQQFQLILSVQCENQEAYTRGFTAAKAKLAEFVAGFRQRIAMILSVTETATLVGESHVVTYSAADKLLEDNNIYVSIARYLVELNTHQWVKDFGLFEDNDSKMRRILEARRDMLIRALDATDLSIANHATLLNTAWLPAEAQEFVEQLEKQCGKEFVKPLTDARKRYYDKYEATIKVIVSRIKKVDEISIEEATNIFTYIRNAEQLSLLEIDRGDTHSALKKDFIRALFEHSEEIVKELEKLFEKLASAQSADLSVFSKFFKSSSAESETQKSPLINDITVRVQRVHELARAIRVKNFLAEDLRICTFFISKNVQTLGSALQKSMSNVVKELLKTEKRDEEVLKKHGQLTALCSQLQVLDQFLPEDDNRKVYGYARLAKKYAKDIPKEVLEQFSRVVDCITKGNFAEAAEGAQDIFSANTGISSLLSENINRVVWEIMDNIHARSTELLSSRNANPACLPVLMQQQLLLDKAEAFVIRGQLDKETTSSRQKYLKSVPSVVETWFASRLREIEICGEKLNVFEFTQDCGLLSEAVTSADVHIKPADCEQRIERVVNIFSSSLENLVELFETRLGTNFKFPVQLQQIYLNFTGKKAKDVDWQGKTFATRWQELRVAVIAAVNKFCELQEAGIEAGTLSYEALGTALTNLSRQLEGLKSLDGELNKTTFARCQQVAGKLIEKIAAIESKPDRLRATCDLMASGIAKTSYIEEKDRLKVFAPIKEQVKKLRDAIEAAFNDNRIDAKALAEFIEIYIKGGSLNLNEIKDTFEFCKKGVLKLCSHLFSQTTIALSECDDENKSEKALEDLKKQFATIADIFACRNMLQREELGIFNSWLREIPAPKIVAQVVSEPSAVAPMSVKARVGEVFGNVASAVKDGLTSVAKSSRFTSFSRPDFHQLRYGRLNAEAFRPVVPAIPVTNLENQVDDFLITMLERFEVNKRLFEIAMQDGNVLQLNKALSFAKAWDQIFTSCKTCIAMMPEGANAYLHAEFTKYVSENNYSALETIFISEVERNFKKLEITVQKYDDLQDRSETSRQNYYEELVKFATYLQDCIDNLVTVDNAWLTRKQGELFASLKTLLGVVYGRAFKELPEHLADQHSWEAFSNYYKELLAFTSKCEGRAGFADITITHDSQEINAAEAAEELLVNFKVLIKREINAEKQKYETSLDAAPGDTDSGEEDVAMLELESANFAVTKAKSGNASGASGASDASVTSGGSDASEDDGEVNSDEYTSEASSNTSLLEKVVVADLAKSKVSKTTIEEILKFILSLQTVIETFPKMRENVSDQLADFLTFIRDKLGLEAFLELVNALQDEPSGTGMLVIQQQECFAPMAIALRNKLTSAVGIDEILNELEMKKNGRIVKFDAQSREDLKGIYVEFQEHYLKFREDKRQKVDFFQNKDKYLAELADNLKAMVAGVELQTNAAGKIIWPQEIRKKLPEIAACIFAMWTLDKSTVNSKNEMELMVPHAAQVVSIMLMLNALGNQEGILASNFVQLLSGEGKSVAIASAASILASLGCNVDVACYSRYLSDRDYAAFEGLFKKLGLDDAIKYGTFNSLFEDLLNENIDLRAATAELFETTKIPAANAGRATRNKLRVMIADEVDVFFNKDFYANSYSNSVILRTEEMFNLMKEIWDAHRNPSMKLNLELVRTFKSYQLLQQRYPSWMELINQNINAMIATLGTDPKTKLPYYRCSDEHQYIITKEGKISYAVQDGMEAGWTCGYQTVFAYYQEFLNGKISEATMKENFGMLISCGSYSYKRILEELGSYSCTLGSSGTLRELSPSEINVIESYGINQQFFIPSAYGEQNLAFPEKKAVTVHESAHFYNKLVEQIKFQRDGAKHKNIRPVMVFFKDKQSLEKFRNSEAFKEAFPDLIAKGQVVSLLKETGKDQLETNLSKVVLPGRITLAEESFGRGRDFITWNDDILKEGGLHSMAAFLPPQLSGQRQIALRAARQGQHGSFSIHLDINELLKDFPDLTREQIKEWIAKETLYENLQVARIRQFDKTYKADTDKAEKNHEVLGVDSEEYWKLLQTGSLPAPMAVNSQELQHVVTHVVEVSGQPVEQQKPVAAVPASAVQPADKSPQACELLKKINKTYGLMTQEKSNAKAVRVMVAIDATNSMGGVMDNVKATISDVVVKLTQALIQNKLSADLFAIQLAVYRNYGSYTENVFERSQMTRDEKRLQKFISEIYCMDGEGREAIEVPLRFVVDKNEENAVDAPNLVMVVGDAVPNIRENIRDRHKGQPGAFWDRGAYVGRTAAEHAEWLKEKNIKIHTFAVEGGNARNAAQPTPQNSFGELSTITGGEPCWIGRAGDANASATIFGLFTKVLEEIANGDAQLAADLSKTFMSKTN